MSAAEQSHFLGRPMVDANGNRAVDDAASAADLKSLASSARIDGEERRILNGAKYQWNAASVLADDGFFVLQPTDAPSAGRWLLCAGQVVDFNYAFTFSLADATVVMTVPTGARVQLVNSFWHVSTSFTGGTASAIGLKGGAATGLTTAGDILGGSGGDLAATLASTGPYAQGTVGAKMGKPVSVLNAADTVIYNKIASAFTAGVGEIHLELAIIANAGA